MQFALPPTGGKHDTIRTESVCQFTTLAVAAKQLAVPMDKEGTGFQYPPEKTKYEPSGFLGALGSLAFFSFGTFSALSLVALGIVTPAYADEMFSSQGMQLCQLSAAACRGPFEDRKLGRCTDKDASA